MVFPIKPKIIEIIIVLLFEISFILLAVHAENIDDISRMRFAIISFFITLIPYIVERLLRISFPFGIKIMIPFALFIHIAGGIMRWYWDFSWMYYDKIAHMISGFALGLVIFAIILTLILFSKRELQKRSVLLGTAVITFLFGIFWEYEELSIDSVMMTTYSGGLYDSIGDTIGNIIGIILCLYVAKRWMDSVPAHKSLSTLIRNDGSPVHGTSRRRKYKQDL
jgi:VanZ family protein